MHMAQDLPFAHLRRSLWGSRDFAFALVTKKKSPRAKCCFAHFFGDLSGIMASFSGFGPVPNVPSPLLRKSVAVRGSCKVRRPTPLT